MEWGELEKEVVRCIKCGSCQTVCPIFKELRSEASVARGKVNLIKAVIHGDVEANENFAERMGWCLNCKACVTNCPSGVQVDQLVLQARRKLVEDKGLPFIKRIILRIGLRNRWLFDVGMKMGAITQGLMFRTLDNGRGMLPRLPMGLDYRRLITPVSDRPLRSRYPETIVAAGAVKKVALFTGCMANYINPAIGEAVIKILVNNNISIVIPANQHCCGTPAFANGDIPTAVELAKATVDHFADLDVDAVLTMCGSCGCALRNEYRKLLKDEAGYQEKVEKLSNKVADFTEFMAGIGLKGDLHPVEKVVTYHESCHLTRGQGIKSQPRQLMNSIPGIEIREMKDPGRCCGAAGSFSLSHYDLSMKINHHKVEDIVATKAAVLVTGCPSCIMHIKDGLNQGGYDIEVLHTAELIAKAYD
jgi:glycolate oxidase iron-sulfur subunit